MEPGNPKRRRHPRLQMRLAVRLATIDPERDPATGETCFRSSEEVAVNVSRGGAFLLTDEPVAPGRRVLLEIELPGGESVEAVGRVAWTRWQMKPAGARSETGLGIEFIGGEPDQLARLERHLAVLERSADRTPRRPGGPPATTSVGGSA